MLKPFKNSTLSSVMAICSFGIAASSLCVALSAPAQASDAVLDVRFKLDIEGQKPCVVTSPLIFDLGTLPSEGVWTVDASLDIKCESSDVGFYVMFESMSSSTHIYRDDYIRVFTGSPDYISPDGYVRINGHYNGTRDACEGTMNSDTIGGEKLYLIGGKIDTSSFAGFHNKNACMYRIGSSETGEYTIPVKAMVIIDEMPDENNIDSIPENILVPVTLTPFMAESD